MTEITKDMNIDEILERVPASAKILAEVGLKCVGCPMSSGESLEEGAKSHGFSDEDIDKIVEKINSLGDKNEI